MICKDCQCAGDALSKSMESEDSRVKSDELGRAKTLHARCKENACFCQHRV